MDIILMIFGMSVVDDITKPPQAPQAAVVEVIKYDSRSRSFDPHDDMWDSNWANSKTQSSIKLSEGKTE
jgi:hypothetical protein